MDEYLYTVDGAWQYSELIEACAKLRIEIVEDDGNQITFKGEEDALAELHAEFYPFEDFDLVEA